MRSNSVICGFLLSGRHCTIGVCGIALVCDYSVFTKKQPPRLGEILPRGICCLFLFVISENFECGRFRELGVSCLDPCNLLIGRHLSVDCVDILFDSVLCIREINRVKEELSRDIAIFLVDNNLFDIIDR